MEGEIKMDSIMSTVIEFIPIKGPLVTIMGKPPPLSQGKGKCSNEILELSILKNKYLLIQKSVLFFSFHLKRHIDN